MTALYSGALGLAERLEEIEVLLKEASLCEFNHTRLYSSLCRSAQVLLSAHFEGYLKSVIINAIQDINQYSEFSKWNPKLQRRLVDYYVKSNPDTNKTGKSENDKATQLLQSLQGLDIKLIREYFHSENSNPKESVIDKVGFQFGISSFTQLLEKSCCDSVFSNTYPDNVYFSNYLYANLLDSIHRYPYQADITILKIDESKKGQTFWSGFIDDFLVRRHSIVHGNEINHIVGHQAILEDKIKIQVLLFSFTFLLSGQINPATWELHTT